MNRRSLLSAAFGCLAAPFLPAPRKRNGRVEKVTVYPRYIGLECRDGGFVITQTVDGIATVVYSDVPKRLVPLYIEYFSRNVFKARDRK